MMGQRDKRKWKEGAGYRSAVEMSAEAPDGILRTYWCIQWLFEGGLIGRYVRGKYDYH
jgi:hypothetical protein